MLSLSLSLVASRTTKSPIERCAANKALLAQDYACDWTGNTCCNTLLIGDGGAGSFLGPIIRMLCMQLAPQCVGVACRQRSVHAIGAQMTAIGPQRKRILKQSTSPPAMPNGSPDLLNSIGVSPVNR